MYLMRTEDGTYTLKKLSPTGVPTKSAHPCRFSPDDKFSRHRVTIKKRYGACRLPAVIQLSSSPWVVSDFASLALPPSTCPLPHRPAADSEDAEEGFRLGVSSFSVTLTAPSRARTCVNASVYSSNAANVITAFTFHSLTILGSRIRCAKATSQMWSFHSPFPRRINSATASTASTRQYALMPFLSLQDASAFKLHVPRL